MVFGEAVKTLLLLPHKSSSFASFSRNRERFWVGRTYRVVRRPKHIRIDPSEGYFVEKPGAGEANRTPDPNLGKVMLYP